MNPRSFLMIVAAAALLGACAETEETAVTNEPAFWTPDAQQDGAQLWLEVTEGAEGIDVALRGRELGGVFGWSAHVAFDPALTVAVASADPSLGAEAEALYIAAPWPGDVSLGGSRRGPDLGERTIDEDTRLAVLRFARGTAVASRLDITKAIVRRADGSYVPVVALGGALDTEGAR